MRAALIAALLVLSACATARTGPAFYHPPLSPDALIEHVRVLASDEFEGRAPGTRGEALTLEYVERAFAQAGLRPGNRGSWRQETPLVGATLTNEPVLSVRGPDGARTYAYGEGFTAWTRRLEPRISVEDAELVFVGHGIVAPELNWNDYAGLDMRGRIAIILVNDPDFDTGDDRGFGGRAMTYYGRWTYKFEEAARQGAAGALIVHQTAPAAYPWGVVGSRQTGPRFDVVREDRGASRAGFEGWIQESVAREMFANADLSFDRLRQRAQQRGFRAVPLGALRGSITLETRFEALRSSNLIGVLEGRERPDEYVIYTAHWDHLGRCAPVDGDDICNGAFDNATGVAGLIELARRFRAEGAPARSVAFIALAAEEQGLLGALYYSQHPVIAARQSVAAINMDGVNSTGRTRDVEVIGYGKSEMDDLMIAAARAQGRRVEPDSSPEAGYFYRSDHLHFAQLGIPTLYMKSGVDMVEGGAARGRRLAEAYVTQRYHKPADEVTDAWDMRGGAEDVALLYAVGRNLADSEIWPGWRAGSEFRGVREASGR